MGSFCFLEKKKEIEIVSMGFSWKPFILTFVWGLSQDLWIYSVPWYLVTLIFYFLFINSMIEPNILLIFSFLSCLFWGFYGNSILINDLIASLTKKKSITLSVAVVIVVGTCGAKTVTLSPSHHPDVLNVELGMLKSPKQMNGRPVTSARSDN